MITKINQWSEWLRRKTSGGNFIPEIDGLRFLAIGSVLVFHVMFSLAMAYGRKLGPFEESVLGIASRNPFGVKLFFVVSGFILALPFIRHFVEGEKPVNIGRYYLRRLTRLEPPYIITLILFFAASWFLMEGETEGDDIKTFFIRLFYAHGLVYQHPPTLNGVTWSLEVEVQFYLLVPLLVQIFRFPAIVRMGALAVAVVALPFVPWRGVAASTVLNALPFFLAGFLLADLYLRFRNWQGSVICDCVAIGIFGFTLYRPYQYFVPLLLLAFLFLMFRGKWLRQVFAYKPIYIIGGMCYSIYLLHYPVMAMFSKLMVKTMPQFSFASATTLSLLICVPLVMVISTCFFVSIERPCMDHTWPKKLLAWMKGDVSIELPTAKTRETTKTEEKEADLAGR